LPKTDIAHQGRDPHPVTLAGSRKQLGSRSGRRRRYPFGGYGSFP
jgi:hypothetical protein